MIVAGVVLLILGMLFHVSILWTLGIIVLVIGAVLFLVGAAGRPVGGRRHYW
jgi:Zn-dependent membrane protease YugP